MTRKDVVTNTGNSLPFFPTLRLLGYQFRLIGWGSLWLKLILAVVSLVIVLFASINNNRPATMVMGQPVAPPSGIGVGIGIPFLLGGVICLFISVYWSYRYTQLGHRFLVPTPKMQPSKAETTQLVKLALITDLIGMLLMVLGGESIGGVLFGKALSQGNSAFIMDPSRFIQPSDLLTILACIHGITGLFAGVASTLWLLQRTVQQKPPGGSDIVGDG
jgi:Protein of unknown function (DUF3611)